jgi:hypothetical protein
MPNFLDEIIHISIHKDEVKHEPKAVQKFIKDNSDMEFYPGGLKKGKNFDKIKEFKRLLKELGKVRARYKGEENNIECLVYDQILELFGRMMLHELRKVELEKLL